MDGDPPLAADHLSYFMHVKLTERIQKCFYPRVLRESCTNENNREWQLQNGHETIYKQCGRIFLFCFCFSLPRLLPVSYLSTHMEWAFVLSSNNSLPVGGRCWWISISLLEGSRHRDGGIGVGIWGPWPSVFKILTIKTIALTGAKWFQKTSYNPLTQRCGRAFTYEWVRRYLGLGK